MSQIPVPPPPPGSSPEQFAPPPPGEVPPPPPEVPASPEVPAPAPADLSAPEVPAPAPADLSAPEAPAPAADSAPLASEIYAPQAEPYAPVSSADQGAWQAPPSASSAGGYASGPVPMAPPAPNVLGETFSVWGRTLGNVLSGKPQIAHARSVNPQFAAPGTPLLWLLIALIHGVVSGLLSVLALNVLNPYRGLMDVPAGTLFLAFFLTLVLAVGFLVLRGLAIMGIFATGRRSISFTNATNIAGLGYLAALPSTAAVLLFVLAPNNVVAILVGLLAFFFFLLGESSIYVMMAKWGRFDRSVVLPYAGLTTLWVVACALLAFIVARVLGG